MNQKTDECKTTDEWKKIAKQTSEEKNEKEKTKVYWRKQTYGIKKKTDERKQQMNENKNTIQTYRWTTKDRADEQHTDERKIHMDENKHRWMK